jgi:hypothetical protein
MNEYDRTILKTLKKSLEDLKVALKEKDLVETYLILGQMTNCIEYFRLKKN